MSDCAPICCGRDYNVHHGVPKRQISSSVALHHIQQLPTSHWQVLPLIGSKGLRLTVSFRLAASRFRAKYGRTIFRRFHNDDGLQCQCSLHLNMASKQHPRSVEKGALLGNTGWHWGYWGHHWDHCLSQPRRASVPAWNVCDDCSQWTHHCRHLAIGPEVYSSQQARCSWRKAHRRTGGLPLHSLMTARHVHKTVVNVCAFDVTN
jgi:hypothetical protein